MAVLYTTNFSSDDLATNWTVVTGTWAVTGGVLRVSAGGTPRIIRTDSTAYAAVADMRVDVKYAAGTSFDGGPTVRHQSAADTCYYVEASATGIDVFRRVAGVDSATLGSRSGAALGDTIGLEVTGVGATVTLKVFKNGVQQGADILDTNAARIVAAGWGGILEWSSTGDQDFDDFSVDDLVSGGGAVMVAARMPSNRVGPMVLRRKYRSVVQSFGAPAVSTGNRLRRVIVSSA